MAKNPAEPPSALCEHQEKEPMKEQSAAPPITTESTSKPTEAVTSWAKFTDEALAQRMFTDADRLPMEFAREVISRNERMIPLLTKVIRHEYNWHRNDAGWCAVVHATYLLGAIGGEDAINPLMDALRFAEAFEDDWVVPELPAIFSRLGPKALEALRPIAAIPDDDWMLRHSALSCMAAITLKFPKEEEDIFKLIAIIADSEREDDDIRVWAGQILLDFARAEYRDILLRLVDSGMSKPLYGRAAVRRGLKMPNVARYCSDWIRFYEEDHISKRRRDAEKDRLPERHAWNLAISSPWGEDPDIERKSSGNPYAGPKYPVDAPESELGWLHEDPIGKSGSNDPCPCGSGKKFGKCCQDRPVGRA